VSGIVSATPPPWDPPAAGFGACNECRYRRSGSAVLCWSCAEAGLGRSVLDGRPRCSVCDQPLRVAGTCDNYWCRREDRGFDVVWAIASHIGVLRDVIARYKYRGGGAWSEILGRVVAGYLLANSPCFEDIGLIIACPGRPERDHVSAIVNVAASAIGDLWAFDDGRRPCLVKGRQTVPLMAAGPPASRRLWAACDLRPALSVPHPERVDGRRVLVVDDVLTDGSTLREVALVLRAAGAAAVSGLVLARQTWWGPRPARRAAAA
jgi:predicted amidophosphoribosyltransferase